MNTKVYLYRVTDQFGNEAVSGLVEETDNDIFLTGVKSRDGTYVNFESKPDYLLEWCEENWLDLTRVELEFHWSTGLLQTKRVHCPLVGY